MGLFGFNLASKKSKEVTKEELWSLITITYTKFAEKINDYNSEVEDLRDKISRMKSAGLCNTQNYKVLQNKIALSERNSKISRFLVDTKVTYPNSIVLPWNELFNICRKYNLECAPMHDKYYDKLIPNENIEELFSAKMSDWYNTEYGVNKFEHINKIDIVFEDKTRSEDLSGIIDFVSRIPFIPMIDNNYYSKNFIVKDKLNSTAESLGMIPSIHEIINYESSMLYRNDWVICAPSDDIKVQTIIGLETKSKYKARMEAMRVKDPLVGKFCKYGFIIFSKWGDEATLDEVLKWGKVL